MFKFIKNVNHNRKFRKLVKSGKAVEVGTNMCLYKGYLYKYQIGFPSTLKPPYNIEVIK